MNAILANHSDESDVRALRYLWHHADLQRWMGHGIPTDEDAEDLLSEWKKGNAAVWLLFGAEDTPVAYLFAIEGDDPRYLGVHIGATRHGRGALMTSFVKACMEHCRIFAGRDYILEGVMQVSNRPAIAFAKKFGFTEYHRDEDFVTFRRELR
jgi:RimJ/RimL family protein N-acetyltransferase